MKTATVTEAKNGLSALLDQVKAGDAVVITERGIPIARIVPVTQVDDPDGRVARLERAGILRRAAGPVPYDLIASAPPTANGGPSLSELIIDERRTGW